MKARRDALRAAWLARPQQQRHAAAALAAGLGLIVLALLWSSLEGEQARLRKAVPLAQARLQRMQDDAAEVVRLRGQAVAATPQSALADAVAASIRSRHLELSVSSDGADRVQVHGNAGFDETVAWLAAVQQDYKLRVVSLAATRAGAAARIDAVLAAAAP